MLKFGLIFNGNKIKSIKGETKFIKENKNYVYKFRITEEGLKNHRQKLKTKKRIQLLFDLNLETRGANKYT